MSYPLQRGPWMKRPNTVPAAILAVLLLACLVAVYVTRDSRDRQIEPAKNTAGDQPAAANSHADAQVDSQLLATANQMAALAENGDEQNAAREALRLSDHEVDLAFATALREAAAYRPPAAGPLRDIIARINQLKAQIAAGQVRIAQLTKQAASTQTASNGTDQLDLANAQLALDQDDLADAQQDLAREGGDPHSAIERALQEHEATGHQTAQALKGASASPTATLVEQARTWLSLGSMDQRVLAAGQEAADKGKSLADRHNQLEKQSNPSAKTGAQTGANTADQIASLHRLSEQRKTL